MWYTWVERGTVRVKCLAQEHNSMSPARTRTRTVRSGDEPTNHEAIVPECQLEPYWGLLALLPRPRANIPQYGPRARLERHKYFYELCRISTSP